MKFVLLLSGLLFYAFAIASIIFLVKVIIGYIKKKDYTKSKKRLIVSAVLTVILFYFCDYVDYSYRLAANGTDFLGMMTGMVTIILAFSAVVLFAVFVIMAITKSEKKKRVLKIMVCAALSAFVMFWFTNFLFSIAYEQEKEQRTYVEQTTPDTTEVAKITETEETTNVTANPETEATEESKILPDSEPEGYLYELSGIGDDIITNVVVDTYAKLIAVHSGERNFVIKAHYGDRYDLLVNTHGLYDGGETLLLPRGEYTIEVKASSPWEIKIQELGTASDDTFSGNGDCVTPIFISSSDVYHITNNGEGHISVKGYYGSGHYELLVNEIGNYDGKVMFKKEGNVCFFTIETDGDYTIEPVD